MFTHCTALQQSACAILRWEDLTCNLHQQDWRGGMQTPTVGDTEALKRVARCLIGHGRLIQELARRVEEPCHIVVFTDSDKGSSLRTRTSTS